MKLKLPFFLVLSMALFVHHAIRAQSEFTWDNLNDVQTANLSQTVIGVTASVDSSPNTRAGQASFCGLEGSWIIRDFRELTVNFNQPIDVTSIYVANDACGLQIPDSFILTPTGGSNVPVTRTLPTSSGLVTVNWQNVTGFTVRSNATNRVIVDTITFNTAVNSAPVPDVTNLPNVTAQCEVISLTAPTATDDTAGVITGSTTTTLPITTQGTTVVTWTYDDGNGNTSIQTQNVIINDVTAPLITCPSNVSGTTPVINYPAVTTVDNCDGILNSIAGMTYLGFRDGKNLFISDSSFSGAAAFADAVSKGGTVVTVTDAAFNAYISSQLVAQSIGEAHIGYSDALNEDVFIWQDGSSSTYRNFRSGEPNNTDGGEDYVTISSGGTWNDVGARGTGRVPYILQISDGAVIQTAGLASGATYPLGTTTNTFAAYDTLGNTSTCSFDVIVSDTTAPVADVSMLSDVTAECEVTSLTAPTATDDFSGSITGTTTTTLPVTTQGTTVVTWTYDDGNGNTSTQTQNIIIDDVTAPVVTCPTNITNNSSVVTFTNPTATDNCDTIPFGGFASNTPLSGMTYLGFFGGKNLYVSDNTFSGAAAFADAQSRGGHLVTITDATLNSQIVTALNSLGIVNAYIGYSDAASEGTFVWQDGSNSTYQNFSSGEPNNSGTGEDYVHIRDTAGQWNDTSNSNFVYVYQSPNARFYQSAGLASGATYPLGTTTNTFVVTDASGNTSTCSFDVVVTDNTAPVPDVANLPDVTGECEITTLTAPTATDDFAGTVTGTTTTTLPITTQGTTVVTWTYDDGNGNTATQTQNIILEDVSAPVLTCSDVTVVLDMNGQADISSFIGNAGLKITEANPGFPDMVEVTNFSQATDYTGYSVIISSSYTDINISNNTVWNLGSFTENETKFRTDGSNNSWGNNMFWNPGSPSWAMIVDPSGNVIDAIFWGWSQTDIDNLEYSFNGNQISVDNTVWAGNGIDALCSNSFERINISTVSQASDYSCLPRTDGSITVSGSAVRAEDNCSSVTLTYSPSQFDCSQVNTVVPVTVTATDASGNTSTCSINVTVEDNIAPTPDIVMLEDVTAECEVIALTPPTATDNCTGTVTVTNDAIFPIIGEGTTTVVTWTFDDGNGNTTTQTQNVIIDDVTAPVADVAMLADVTAECEVISLTAPTATDNCSGIVTVTSDATLPITNQGTTVVTWTYDDGNGNTSTQTQNVVIDDVTAPVLDSVSLTDLVFNCEVTSLTAPTATDNCAGVITGTTTFPITSTSVITWTFDDGNGNTTIQNQLVIIERRSIDLVADVTACDSFTLPAITGDFLTGGQMYYTESGGLGTAFAEADLINFADFASYPVTLFAYDGDNTTGCSAETSFQLTLTETPVINPIADVSACDQYTLPALAVGNYYSFPGGNGTLINAGAVIGTTQTIFVYAEDVSGNCIEEESFTVNILPLDDASFNYDATTYCPNGVDPTAIITGLNGGTFTSTLGLDIDATTGLIDLDASIQGTYVVTYTTNGSCPVSSSVNVTVEDLIAPVPDVTTLANVTADCEVTSLVAPTATDNCNGTVTVTNDAVFPISGEATTTVVTWTFDDGNGNTSTQIQNVIIDDVTAPVPDVTTLADVTAECEVTSLVAPTATDNCSGTVTVTNDAVFPITGDGTTTVVTWTYDDGNGNTTTQAQNVIIDDVTAPVANVTTLADITAECEVTNLVAPTATDNCNGTVTVTSDAVFPITGESTTTVVTWTYDDGNGNTSTQTQNVIIDDVTAPVSDLAILTDVIAECEVTSLVSPTATDNCNGTVTVTSDAIFPITGEGTTTVVTWTYDDGNGNTSTQIQNVIIDDVTAPVANVTALPNLIFNCEVDSLQAPTASDNCVGSVSGVTNVNFPITSTTSVTWTYDDGNGNISSQDQLIVIERRAIDLIADVIECDSVTLPVITGDFLTGGQMYYTESGGNGIAFAEADTINFSDFASYPVTLYVYDEDVATGCSAEISFELTLNESPIIGSINDVSSCEQYELPVLSVGNYYTFPGGNGTLLTAGTIIDSTQTIFVYAEDTSGNCSDETSFVVTINPTDLLGATLNDNTFTYDGSVQSLSVENIPSTATVVYTNNNQTEAGTYVVTATITSATASCSELVLTATMTIDRAPQTITFDPIQRRRLNVDPDFQLNASSTSGLPIDYNFSFTGANPAATVSNTGFVNLLAEGEVLIFASQPGNSNYLPANTVQQFLEVYLGDNADLDSITIDGNVINNPGTDIYYLIDCGSNVDSVDIILENSDLATFDPSMTFTIATPRPGIYREQIIVTADNGRDTRTYNLTVERRFEFDDIVEQKYNNTLIVNNNFDNNGGYSFVAYEWFKNGRLVSTEQFFSEGDNASDLLDPTAAYYVRMTTTTGDILQTCISTIELGNTFSLTVLENPVIEGRSLNVRADYPIVELENAIYQLYSASGQFIMEVPVQGYDSEINLSESLPVGMYRLVLITSQRTESVNFIKN